MKITNDGVQTPVGIQSWRPPNERKYQESKSKIRYKNNTIKNIDLYR